METKNIGLAFKDMHAVPNNIPCQSVIFIEYLICDFDVNEIFIKKNCIYWYWFYKRIHGISIWF